MLRMQRDQYTPFSGFPLLVSPLLSARNLCSACAYCVHIVVRIVFYTHVFRENMFQETRLETCFESSPL